MTTNQPTDIEQVPTRLILVRHLDEAEISKDFKKNGFSDPSQLVDLYLNRDSYDNYYNARILRVLNEGIMQKLESISYYSEGQGLIDGSRVQMYYSGLLRTQVTAEAIAKAIGYKGEFIVDQELEQRIKNADIKNCVHIIVAHSPSIGQYLSNVSRENFRITPGKAFYVEPEGGFVKEIN